MSKIESIIKSKHNLRYIPIERYPLSPGEEQSNSPIGTMLAPRKKLWSTPSTAIDIALQFANLDVNDVVYDVGCGDGRVLIQMAALSVALPNDKSSDRGHELKNIRSEHHMMIDNKEQQSSSTSFTHGTNYHHHCKHFVGIEISSDRANEARQNIQNAYESNQIPKHVSIQIIVVMG